MQWERNYVPLRRSHRRQSHHPEHRPHVNKEVSHRRLGGLQCLPAKKKKLRVCHRARRRLGLNVRQRSGQQCDGAKPTCSHCIGQASRCEYRDAGGSSRESKDLIVEIFGILNQLPATDAIQVLNETSKEDEALPILAIIRNRPKVPTAVAYVGSETTAESLSSTGQGSYELEMQNPMAYPSLSKGDGDLFGKDAYRALTKPTARGTSPSQ